jgi:hypothetical protein
MLPCLTPSDSKLKLINCLKNSYFVIIPVTKEILEKLGLGLDNPVAKQSVLKGP